MFITILIWAAILQGFFLSVFLIFSKKYRNKENLYLTFFILSLLAEAISIYLPFESIGNYNLTQYFNFPEVKLFFPAFFLHFISLKTGQFPRFKAYLRVNYVIALSVLLLTPISIMLFIVTGWALPHYFDSNLYENLFLAQQVLAFCLSAIVLYYSYKLFLYAEIKVKDELSDFIWYGNNWLKQFILVFLVILLLWGIELLRIAFNWNQGSLTVNIIWFFLVFVIYWVSYKSLQIVEIPQNLNDQNHTDAFNPIISAEESERIGNRLESAMATDKLYLNPNLTIHELSKHVSIPYRKISQYIKENEKTNYSIWLNSYRVEYAIALLKEEGKNLTIEAIGQKSGFNSRSSLYLAFKKIKSVTPSNYLP